MNILEYSKNIHDYLAHNSRGEWKNHKYIRKEGNRYIYPEDLKKGTNTTDIAKNAAASRYGGDAARYANSTGAKLKIQKQIEENVKKNADAAKLGGDAARYANSTGAKLKIQKQLEETIAKNADAAKYGGDAARYAKKPQSDKQPTNVVTNNHHGQTVKPDENKPPVNVEKTPKVTEEKKQEAYNYACDAWNKIDETQLGNFIYLTAFNLVYGGYGGSDKEYDQAVNYIDEFTNKVFEDAAAKYGDAFDSDGLYNEIYDNLNQAVTDTYTVLIADFQNQQMQQQQLLSNQMMGFRSKSLPSRNPSPNSATKASNKSTNLIGGVRKDTNAYKNVDQGKIYKKKRG